MNPAAVLQFERMIGEYARWRAVPEKERSPAPAWWWGPAMELRNMAQPLPAGCRDRRESPATQFESSVRLCQHVACDNLVSCET